MVDQNKASVSAAIVNYYNYEKTLKDAIKCVLNQTIKVDEIIVINNGDKVDLKFDDDRIRVLNWNNLAYPQNVGFGKGINFAVNNIESDKIFVVNPDLFVEADCLEKLLDVSNDKNICGPVIYNEDRTIYPSARIEPGIFISMMHALISPFTKNNIWTKKYHNMVDIDKGFKSKVDWISGAVFLLDKKLFEDIGGFDTRFFMYLEDVDLCKKVREVGGEIFYMHNAFCTHIGGLSTGSSLKSKIKLVYEHHKSAVLFYNKWSKGIRKLLLPIAVFVLSVRFIVQTISIVLQNILGEKK